MQEYWPDFVVFRQQLSSISQRNKIYEALDTHTHTILVGLRVYMGFIDNKGNTGYFAALTKCSYLICDSEEKPVFSSWAFSSPSCLSTALFCSTSCLTSISPWPSNNRSWDEAFPAPPHAWSDRESELLNKMYKSRSPLSPYFTAHYWMLHLSWISSSCFNV